MSFIIGDALKNKIQTGVIKISPFNPANVGPASVDLTLGHEFRRFKIDANPISINSQADYRDHSYRCDVAVDGSQPFVVQPGELVLGITREAVTMPKTMVGLLEGRSRFARFGVLIHVTAGLMQPGLTETRTVLEIINFSKRPVLLYPGEPICQFAFLQAEGEAQYSGAWKSQDL